MKIVTASRLLREAADVLEPIRDDVVVIGALAVQIALDGHDVALAVTRDVDAGVATDAVGRVVEQLERSGLRRSELPHEQGFTWIRGDLKVQLLRPFHPFPPKPAVGPARQQPHSRVGATPRPRCAPRRSRPRSLLGGESCSARRVEGRRVLPHAAVG